MHQVIGKETAVPGPAPAQDNHQHRNEGNPAQATENAGHNPRRQDLVRNQPGRQQQRHHRHGADQDRGKRAVNRLLAPGDQQERQSAAKEPRDRI